MISVAEETGRLDTELVRLAGVTEVTLDRQLKTAVSLAEPLMLFAIAAVIGVIFIGMVIPIFRHPRIKSNNHPSVLTSHYETPSSHPSAAPAVSRSSKCCSSS